MSIFKISNLEVAVMLPGSYSSRVSENQGDRENCTHTNIKLKVEKIQLEYLKYSRE